MPNRTPCGRSAASRHRESRPAAKAWLAAVETACAEALADGVHSTHVILNILARRRDPAPVVTILAPEALRLRQASLSDCVRYDRLRRAG